MLSQCGDNPREKEGDSWLVLIPPPPPLKDIELIFEVINCSGVLFGCFLLGILSLENVGINIGVAIIQIRVFTYLQF